MRVHTLPPQLTPLQTQKYTITQMMNNVKVNSHTKPPGSSMPDEICSTRCLQQMLSVTM